jgi:hypothetical protein
MRGERLLKRTWVKVALAAWFATMVAVSAVLLGRHLLPLPPPSGNDPALASSLAGLRRAEDGSRFLAVHVLYSECKCSTDIAEHLLTSERPSDVVEVVLFVGENKELEDKLSARGFGVKRIDADELVGSYRIGAVPMLVVLAPDGTVRYAGGYTTRKQGPDPRDLSIIARARNERNLAALPLFGCAVAEELRRRLDPTGIL